MVSDTSGHGCLSEFSRGGVPPWAYKPQIGVGNARRRARICPEGSVTRQLTVNVEVSGQRQLTVL